MHLGRFHYAIDLLVIEYGEKKMGEKLSQVINTLNAVSTTPNHPEIAKQFKVALDDLRATLVASKLNAPRPVLALILNSISADRHIGEALFSRIKNAIDTNQLAPAMAVQELQKIQKEVQAFFAHATAINNAFTELEVEYDEIDDGEAEIGLLIPSGESSRTLKELGKEVNQWHNALGAIAEVFDPDNNPITIRIFSTTDWMFYLYTTPPTLFGISLCLKGVNQILSDLIRSKKLISDLAGTGTSEELIKQLEKDHDGKLDGRLNSLAEKIVDEHYAGKDEGRKNELKTSVRQGIKSIAEKIATGSKVELKLKAPARPEPLADGEQQTEEHLKKITEIEQLEKLELEIDNDASLILFDGYIEDISGLLPSPDEQEDS